MEVVSHFPVTTHLTPYASTLTWFVVRLCSRLHFISNWKKTHINLLCPLILDTRKQCQSFYQGVWIHFSRILRSIRSFVISPEGSLTYKELWFQKVSDTLYHAILRNHTKQQDALRRELVILRHSWLLGKNIYSEKEIMNCITVVILKSVGWVFSLILTLPWEFATLRGKRPLLSPGPVSAFHRDPNKTL